MCQIFVWFSEKDSDPVGSISGENRWQTRSLNGYRIANRIARAIYKILAGDKYKEIGYQRGDPHEQKVRQHIAALKALGVQILHHNHQLIVSQTRLTVDDAGVIRD